MGTIAVAAALLLLLPLAQLCNYATEEARQTERVVM